MIRQVSKNSSTLLRAALRVTASSQTNNLASSTVAPWMTRAKSSLPTASVSASSTVQVPPLSLTKSVAAASTDDSLPEGFFIDPKQFDFPFPPAQYEVPGKHNHGKRVSQWMYKHVEGLLTTSAGRLDHEAMTDLIIMLTQCNYYREAMGALQFARQNNCKPRITAYSRIISSCYTHERFELALQVFDVMRRDGYIPSFVTYSRSLSSATKANQHGMVLQLFRDLMTDCTSLSAEAQSIACNTLLNSCARNDDYATATWLLEEMRVRHIPMTHSTYNSFLLCVCKSSESTFVELKAIIQEMSDHGMNMSTGAFLSAISACAKWKKWDTVIVLYEKMRSENHVPFVVTTAAAMMAYVKQGMPDKTIALAVENAANGTDLNTFAKQAVITAHLHLGSNEEGLRLCEEMLAVPARDESFLGLVYKLKVQILIALNRIDDALALLEESKGLMDKTINCYRPLILHYAALRQYDEASKYCQILLESNQYVSSSDWIQALSVSIALPDKSSYWEFRRALEVRGPDNLGSIPAELFLESSKVHKQTVATGSSHSKKLLSPKLLKLL
ncbi:Aste57867_23870 [Aphanomyces stellatus]|uniref:Aste57867_23870 protein n=1 Tax=Aphanomyces stellatus TaxID=120398 RepID=A0A485LP64_9STRA|nr:hypothetical protein As57867_023797 [Aphanomyces stellatus]VFU00513.1 Aste57867_23870 [Aphanomyces stellatus]